MKKGQLTFHGNSEFYGRVRLYWEKLSQTERQIAQYILHNEESMENLSIHALARAVDCGVASVIRFSKAVGFSGFADMKYFIQRGKLEAKKRDIGIISQDDVNTVKQKVLQFVSGTLENCALETDNDVLSQICDITMNAPKVYVIGCGAASGIAQAGAALFMSLGILAFSVSDAMLQLRTAGYMQKGDVVFALNYSGYSKEIGDTLMIAHEAGAATVLLTSYKNSLSGKYADYELHTPARNQANSLNYAATSMSQLMLLQIIQSMIQQKSNGMIEKRQNTVQGLSEMNYYDVKQTSIYRGRVRIVMNDSKY